MKKYNHILPAILIAILQAYMLRSWLSDFFWYLNGVALSLEDSPYVHRILLPWMSRVLSALTSITPGYILYGLVVLSSVGCFYSLRYLYLTFHNDENRATVIALLGFLFTIIVTFYYFKVYDVATVMFFALGISFLARKNYLLFCVLYPIATLNRETTFLLTLFFGVFYLFRMSKWLWLGMMSYQGVVYLAIRWLTMQHYGRGGLPFVYSAEDVLTTYATYATVPLILFTGVLLYLANMHGEQKPKLLRIALLILFPVQLALHLLMGNAFEVRVFAESLPILMCLIFYPVKGNPDEVQIVLPTH